MGFISILIVNGLVQAILWILIAIGALGVVLLILSIVFALKYRKNRKKQRQEFADQVAGEENQGKAPGKKGAKRWQMVVSIICLVLSLICFAIIGWAYKVATEPQTTTIETGDGEVTILQEEGFELERSIELDNVSEVSQMLEKEPALMDYISLEGYSPLGMAITGNAVDVAAYLLDNGADIDTLGKKDNEASGEESESAIALYCRISDGGRFKAEMIELLLDHGADVNRTRSAMPPVQFIIQALCKDNDLSDGDLVLLKRFVDAGADLNAVNGSGEDALAYFNEVADEELLNDNQPQQVQKALAIMANP